MEIAKSLIGLGINFAPVPALNVAFSTLDFVWQNVQKASTNRKALKNLAVSTAEILLAINHVLSQRKKAFDDHVRALLRNLEKVLDDFLAFAKKHVSMSLFKILLKNVDVEGEIERFQNRMQNLLMAFTAFQISALGSIDNQLDRIMQGSSIQNSQHKAAKQRPVVTDDTPVHVQASFSEPCTIKLEKGMPYLTCIYYGPVDFRIWGLKRRGSKVVFVEAGEDVNDFSVIQDTHTWSWSRAYKQIYVEANDLSQKKWHDSITIIFLSENAAQEWFTWLRAYAEGSPFSPPTACDVQVRKKYDCLMRKSPGRIERLPPGNSKWFTLLCTPRRENVRLIHPTYLVYDQGGKLPITRVYRAGDTIVLEKMEQGGEDAVAARRYQFDGTEEAKAWWNVWMDVVMGAAQSH